VFDAETTAFLGTGCALIVATVGPDDEPHASRGWAVELLGGEPPKVRVLLDADDRRTMEDARAGGRIAVTAADVRTLRSVQLKGRSVDLAAAAADDAERIDRYCQQFFADIIDTDGVSRPEILQRIVPARFAACTIAVEELYDQTPGPAAGSPLGPRRP
jgi:hypothetical protein